MKIVGCDLHTRYQQVAMLDAETGELVERRLEHESGEARSFYAGLAAPVRVGIEATGHTRWFERMLGELGHELWIGDAAQIRASMVRKQKTDARDAAHLLDLLLSERFPRIWRPSLEERDLRQLVWHRQKLVWMRNAVGNQLHALAMGEGVCRKKKLFTKKGRVELEGLKLGRWASHRRQELLTMLDQLDASMKELDLAVAEQAELNSGTDGTDPNSDYATKAIACCEPVWGEWAQLSHLVRRLSVGEIANKPIGVSSVCPRSTPLLDDNPESQAPQLNRKR
jgi:transposase